VRFGGSEGIYGGSGQRFGTVTSISLTGGTANFDDGTANVPSIGFASEADGTGSGWFRKSAGFLAISINGTEKAAAVSGGWIVNGNVQLVSTGTLSWSGGAYDAAADTTLSRGAAGIIKFASAGSFSANAAVATSITSVGPTGANTTVQEWLTIKNSGGTTRYIPCF
jgi:hypothetical protein